MNENSELEDKSTKLETDLKVKEQEVGAIKKQAEKQVSICVLVWVGELVIVCGGWEGGGHL